jgi:hypothetical protein
MPEPAKVFQDRLSPGDWRVEWEDDDGGVEVTILSGPDARDRAILYANLALSPLRTTAAVKSVGPPATLGQHSAGATIVVWCKEWPHQVEPNRPRWLLGTALKRPRPIDARGSSVPAAPAGRSIWW